MTALAALCGALIAGGLWLALASWRPVPAPIAERQPTVRARAAFERDRVIAAGGAGLLVLILTRWPVAAIGAAVAGWAIAAMPRRADRERHEARTEAIACLLYTSPSPRD